MIELDIQKKLAAFELSVQLTAPEEKAVMLFGPSGAGKSLTLAAIAGLLTPDAGRIALGPAPRVLFDAARGINLPPQARQVGLVKQDLALFPHLTVAQNIAYGLSREPRAAVEMQVRALLRLTNLDGFGPRYPLELSGGQQQRVALARALAIKPAVLLLDEPFSALDQPTRMQLRAELLAIQRRLRTNLLLVTHDLEDAYLLADYVAVIDRGKILQFDVPDRILRAPRSLRVAQIVGMKNILAGVVLGAAALRVGERVLEIEPSAFAPGARVYACIRPERITLVRQERQGPPLPNVLEGDLSAEQSDGHNIALQFRVQGERLVPQQPYDLQIDTPVYVYERLNLGQQKHWRISLKPSEVHLVAGE